MTPDEISSAFNARKAQYSALRDTLRPLTRCLSQLQAAGLDIALDIDDGIVKTLLGNTPKSLQLTGTLRLGLFDFPVGIEIDELRAVLRYDFTLDRKTHQNVFKDGRWIHLDAQARSLDILYDLLISTYAALDTLRDDETAPLFAQLAARQRAPAAPVLKGLGTPSKTRFKPGDA